MRKKFLKNGVIAMMAVCGLAFVSCSEDNDEGMKSYKLTVSYSLPSDVEASNVEELKLILGSTAKNDTLSLDANSKEIELPQGQYKVTVTGKVADEAKAYLSGSTSVDLYANTPVTVNLQKVMQSSLIFKTIHNSGSKQYYMHESYFEIVNNSDEVQYLDNLILTAPTGNQQTANAWQANGYEDLYACGQGSVVAFPGNGHDYPLQPGESVLIANDATNHKLAYGEDVSQAADYASCPDLSNADWEIYLDYNANDVDYDAPNLKTIFYNNQYMFAFGLGVSGRSYVLAKLPEGMTPEAYAALESSVMYEPGTSSTSMSYLVIPSKYVLDAVDIYDPETENHYPTFLPQDDATGVKGNPMYSAKCIRRKVTKIENGRPYYQDTNNSAADFLRDQPLTPGETPTSVDE
ncbi:DUF4876 domain-containing protein [Paraprevotella clara]|uniref:DUF4876 domain-containing protein n=1 Tax=Paraprevotella clara TaxID=454154 RepID=UPI002675ACD2|nr:DUF4876 domain-containing protein [Paraprevotella clara]